MIFTHRLVIDLFDAGVLQEAQVTPVTLKGIFEKVRNEEDRYWKEDEIEDENLEFLEEEIQFEDDNEH